MKQRPSKKASSNATPGGLSGEGSIMQGDKINASLRNFNPKNLDLMTRLARGEKAEVSKKEMLKLTSKNYEQLPEVRKKREEERKKEEMRERLKQVKELEKQRRELKSAGSSSYRR